MDLGTAVLRAYEKKCREQLEKINARLARLADGQAAGGETGRQQIGKELQELKLAAKGQLAQI